MPMPPDQVVEYQFVEHIPGDLAEGVLYISIEYATAVHKCCCGCGNEVVTPLAPRDWKMTFDGETITLFPSIGNWSFDCRSHYWIRNNRIEWARQWSGHEVSAARAADKAGQDLKPTPKQNQCGESTTVQTETKRTLWSKLTGWF